MEHHHPALPPHRSRAMVGRGQRRPSAGQTGASWPAGRRRRSLHEAATAAIHHSALLLCLRLPPPTPPTPGLAATTVPPSPCSLTGCWRYTAQKRWKTPGLMNHSIANEGVTIVKHLTHINYFVDEFLWLSKADSEVINIGPGKVCILNLFLMSS